MANKYTIFDRLILNMKPLLLLLYFALFMNGSLICGQEGYPVPEKSNTHLFYIQHSKNFNTYVYDANMDNTQIDSKNPIDIYRIVYTQGGIKKPLTFLQKTMAYGIQFKQLSESLFELNFTCSKDEKFYLTIDKEHPRVYLTVNDEKLWLEHIFIELDDENQGLSAQAKTIEFYGKDFETNADIMVKSTKI